VVVVVAGGDDPAVADPEHLDVGDPERPTGGGDPPVVVELGDHHLRVAGVVDDQVAGLEPQRALGGGGEVGPDRLAALEAPRWRRRERLLDHGVLGVQVGEIVPASVRDATEQRLEHVAGAGVVGQGELLRTEG
jgi:hypothetical protein